MDQIEEIKNRIDIVEFIGEYIKLQPAGQNWKALCPFHQEKTPSFLVSPSKQIWHCFGCGAGGDIFTFLMKIEGLEFSEALRILAKRAGVALQPVNRQQESKKNVLLDILAQARKFYHYLLIKTEQGKVARQYLKERKVSPEMWEEFSLGYAPAQWETTLRFLRQRGFAEKDISEAGLILRRPQGGYYDRFRGRLMFPLNNLHGQTVGFSARVLLPEEKTAKYINTPQTLVYNKSELLYGLDKAKTAARKERKIILVEGQMDLIAAHQAGTKNVVATSGTALTKQHLKIIKRYADTVLFALDADNAGQEAIRRGAELALAENLNVEVVILPQGKDPDELIKKSPEDWFTALKKPLPFLAYYLDFLLKKYPPLSSPENQKKIKDSYFPLLSEVSRLEKDFYLKKIALRFPASLNILWEELNEVCEKKQGSSVKIEKGETGKIITSLPRQAVLSQNILALLFRFPNYKDFLKKEKLGHYLAKEWQSFWQEIEKSGEKDFFQEEFWQDAEKEKFLPQWRKTYLWSAGEYADIGQEEAEKELKENLLNLKKEYILKSKEKLIQQVQELEESSGKDKEEKINALMEKIAFLNKKLTALNNF